MLSNLNLLNPCDGSLSSFNQEGRIQGRNDLSILTKEGQLQAEAAGKIISSIP